MIEWRLIVGDAREALGRLADGCAQTCVTSPPYWGLRDYGTAQWDGGQPDCDHVERVIRTRESLAAWSAVNAAGGGHAVPTPLQYRQVCDRCGAVRIDQQIGLEPTPDAYVAQLVAVFRDVRRVLRDDGTVWLNLGDSYFGDSPARKSSAEAFSDTWDPANTRSRGGTRRSAAAIGELRPKNLIGIPWRVAFALQADGWYLRSDIIWSKKNCMPESVTDRPTRSHEYIFLLTKSARYFYDAAAIREGFADERMGNPGPSKAGDNPDRNDGGIANGGAGWARGLELGGRNKRSVWHVATQPYPEAHFATFPEALIEPCILAGSRIADTVLDPFCGSGTTGAVAIRHQRNFIGCELNPAYVQLARQRIQAVAPLFAQEQIA